MEYNPNYPVRHLSIRVPWHDNGWNGTVCCNPRQNGACLILKNCAEGKDDKQEEKMAGQSLEKIEDENLYPPCVKERATFMAPFSVKRHVNHPYQKTNNMYEHYASTVLESPPYSAGAVPFYWLMKERANTFSEEYDLGYNEEQEPDIGFNTHWVQHAENHRALFNGFFGHVKPEESLCFFYAKQVPFVEESGRVLVGVGRVKSVRDAVEYDYSSEGATRSLVWEHMVSHTIRPEEKDGFLLPYHAGLKYAEKHPAFDPAELAVVVPSELQFQFSYATEHVNHDAAIRVLMDCVKKLQLAGELGIIKDASQKIEWVQTRINEIETLRGDYPGLGSALCALGVERGHFLAQQVFQQIGEAECLWTFLDKMVEAPEQYGHLSHIHVITNTIKRLWQHFKSRAPERLELLQLLSRFQLTIAQARSIFQQEDRKEDFGDITDQQIIENPYLLYEHTKLWEEPVSLWTIDIGLLERHSGQQDLLPASCTLDEADDSRRLRALTHYVLEQAATEGHTLLPRELVLQRIKKIPLRPPFPASNDIFDISEEYFEPALRIVQMRDGTKAYQLQRLHQANALITKTVKKRMMGKRHSITADWEQLLNTYLDSEATDEQDQRARQEKVAALQELAASRISVLIGPAGSGKTTLLSALCTQPDISAGGILLLAPTGKARVRLEQQTQSLQLKAKTIAQFLVKNKRFKGSTQTYHLRPDEPKVDNYRTVIVDEMSMLTEEMLAALLDNLRGVERLIFAGDHRQLPPIGPGRPFVDIIEYLKPENIENQFPAVGPGYVELRSSMRQRVKDDQERLDYYFANLFSGNPMPAGEDEVFEKVLTQPDHSTIEFIRWEGEEDFIARFEEVLHKELRLSQTEDPGEAFNLSLGANQGKYFNWNQAVKEIENWQVLSPVRERSFGVRNINRWFHKTFREQRVDYAKTRYSKLAGPFGLEEILYGDKVISLLNHRRKDVYPKDENSGYLANGEIGIAIGQFKTKRDKYKRLPWKLEVEFSSQPGYKYGFSKGDFSEEGQQPLELAYAITVHKSQGSEFKTTILVIPNPCFILSRELIYTALTRQKDRVVVLYQGDPYELRSLMNDQHSATLKRVTNLFRTPQLKEIKDSFLEEGLIHCASDGQLLRSKSELLIYELLKQAGLHPKYEAPLEIDGAVKYPDFTITDEDLGEQFYWEHLGMLHDSAYRKRWEAKKAWYESHDILPEVGGHNGTLIITRDSEKGGISVREIMRIVKQMFPDAHTSDKLTEKVNQLISGQEQLRFSLEKVHIQMSSLDSRVQEVKESNSEADEVIRGIYTILDRHNRQISIKDFEPVTRQWLEDWQRLEADSFQFLVSGDHLFDALQKSSAQDYGPFVLQYCRAIENELAEKLFTSFNKHVGKQYSKDGLMSLLEDDLRNDKTKRLAKMVQNNQTEYTLGTMQFALNLIKSEEGKTLQSSPLLQELRAYVDRKVKPQFYEKSNINALRQLTQDFRNKAAHTEPLRVETAQEAKSFIQDWLTHWTQHVITRA